MRPWLMVGVAGLAAWALAQPSTGPKATSRLDAGAAGTDGGARPPALDAAVEVRLPPDASVIFAALDSQAKRLAVAERDATDARLEVERLRKEVAEIRERTALLERRPLPPAADVNTAQFDKLSAQLAELKGQLNDQESRRREADRQASDRRAQTEQAVNTLAAAERTLASGSTEAVDAALRYAEGTLSGPALRYVQAARQAFANHDLAATRVNLQYAMVEAQTPRP